MKNNVKLFVRSMKIMGKRCPIYLTAIFFMTAGWSMFSIMSSLLMKTVVDAADTGDTKKMIYTIIANILGGFVSLLIYRASAIRYNVEAKRAYAKLCNILFAQEISLPYTYYEEHHSGDFMSKLSYDLEKTGAIYGSRLRRTVAPIINVVVYMIPMLILSWQITLCLIGANIILLIINGLFITPMKNVSKVLSKTNAKMTENLSNLLQGMEQARMYSSGKNTVEEFIKENKNYAKQSKKKVVYLACLESCNVGFELICSLLFLMLGITFVQRGYTTLGSLAAIYSLYGSFSFQFLQLGRYLPELVGCLTNAQNIFNFLEEEREPANWYGEKNGKSKNDDAYISFENITFNYREDKPLFKDFDLRVRKHECVAITGASGCGKSTLSKLLLGLYPVKKGDIRICGQSYHDLTNEEIRNMIAYVPQEPYLFNETIMENIRMGRPEATDEEVIEAAKAANAHEFIQELEDGYNTYPGERGNRLSGGQRQRIAIARAVIKDAPILLLDEATSALDNVSEQLVNEALKSLYSKKTIFMIAHRPSTIALADRVCCIEEIK